MEDSMRGRPPRRTVIAVVVGAVVLAAIVFSVGIGVGHGGTGQAAAPAPTRSTPRAVKVIPAGQGSVCGLPGFDLAGTTLTTAPATTWTTVGTMDAPSAPKAGPGRTGSDGLRFCYAHTITGALFAIANIWAMGTDPRLNRPLLQQQTATGPGRTAALKANIPTSNTGLRAQIAGFKVTSYTGATATVDLAFRLNTGELVSVPAPLRWESGDWKIEPADDGSPVYGASTLTDLGDYALWAGAQ